MWIRSDDIGIFALASGFLSPGSPSLISRMPAVYRHYRHFLCFTAGLSLSDVKRCLFHFLKTFCTDAFYFSFAKIAKPAPCKDHSEYFITKFRHAFRIFFLTPRAKENVVFKTFLEIPCIQVLSASGSYMHVKITKAPSASSLTSKNLRL